MPGASLSLTSAPGRCPTRLLGVRARRPGLCRSLPPVGRRHGASPSSRTAGPRHSPWPRRPESDPTAPPKSAASPPAPSEPPSWPPAEGCPAHCLPAAHRPGAGPRTAPSCEPRRPAQPGPAAQAQARPGPGRPPGASMALCWQRADAARQAPGLSGPARARPRLPGPAPRFLPARRRWATDATPGSLRAQACFPVLLFRDRLGSPHTRGRSDRAELPSGRWGKSQG